MSKKSKSILIFVVILIVVLAIVGTIILINNSNERKDPKEIITGTYVSPKESVISEKSIESIKIAWENQYNSDLEWNEYSYGGKYDELIFIFDYGAGQGEHSKTIGGVLFNFKHVIDIYVYNNETIYTLSEACEKGIVDKDTLTALAENLDYIENVSQSLSTTGTTTGTTVLPDSYFTFALNEDKQSYSVKEANKKISGVIAIPKAHNDLPVTSIGDWSFQGCYSLESITIPDSVVSIGEGAFSFCTDLTSITMPESVVSIGEGAFHTCTSLTSITIPNSVKSIGKLAFYCCTSLTSITIPDSVWHIDISVFNGCTSLKSITIPKSVKYIENTAFYGCTSLESISVDANNAVYYSAGNCLIGKASKILILGCQNSVIPTDGSVTSIGDEAFYNCTNLEGISIPDSVTSIGEYAFYGCTSLMSITIPNSVWSIGISAFNGCTSLTSITIGNRVTEIGHNVFWGCTSLMSITIPKSVEHIYENAFSKCTSLTDITYKGTVEQWSAIKKDSGWNAGTPSYTIHCTDGDIKE